ncbi:MAG: cell division protein ZapA [Sphingomonas sp. 28-62-20]|uniref:cell division protein ZapA n=1 Tax=Sphingomonas sp. 28-62-20 TaxID=1970433 RepID=UPI000BCBC807|nr:MAG: cell division protein ZapA [Sphingomonas sp. 28-62-20]
MAEIMLKIGDRQHRVACKDGTEDHLRRIAAMIDSRWITATRASGGLSDERSMLFVALMLADALDEAEQRPSAVAVGAVGGAAVPDLDRLADRLEAIAAALG